MNDRSMHDPFALVTRVGRADEFPQHRRQRGAVAVMVGLMLLALLSMAAFAIDIGRWMVVRNELQNAADAAALAGAGRLMPPVAAQPNWAQALTAAQTAIGLNRSENRPLGNGLTEAGWWNFRERVFDPNSARAAAPDDLPGLRVRIRRREGENDGPVMLAFGRLMKLASLEAQAESIAVISVPASAGPGVLAPFALSQCMLEAATGYWDPVRNEPIGSPPITFVVASGATSAGHCNGCNCAQWTSFGGVDSSSSNVRALIKDGNSQPMAIGDPTYIQPGMKATVYGEVQGMLRGRDVIVPVVASDALTQKGFTPVLGFACLRILDGVQGGSSSTSCSEYPVGIPIPGGGVQENKCVIGRFASTPCAVGGGNGAGGGFSGTFIPPRLVR